jgi:hypothetical protein
MNPLKFPVEQNAFTALLKPPAGVLENKKLHFTSAISFGWWRFYFLGISQFRRRFTRLPDWLPKEWVRCSNVERRGQHARNFRIRRDVSSSPPSGTMQLKPRMNADKRFLIGVLPPLKPNRNVRSKKTQATPIIVFLTHPW